MVSETLNQQIGGTPVSGQFDVTRIIGTGSLGGALDVSLVNGFDPGVNTNYQYVIMTATQGFSGTFASVDFLNPGAGETYNIDYSQADEVILDLNGPVVTNGEAPEPVAFLPIIGIMAEVVRRKMKKSRKGAVEVA